MKPHQNFQLLCTAYRSDQFPYLREKPVLFLGRSNVGKSSLLNTLGGSSKAKVSKQPGKTRSINFYRYGKKLCLVDLPGYGYAKRSQTERQSWGELVGSYMETLKGGTLAFLLMDCLRNLEEEEKILLAGLWDRGVQSEILFTKADRMNQAERQARKRAIEEQWQAEGWESVLSCHFISVKSGEGLKELSQILSRYEKEKDLPTSKYD